MRLTIELDLDATFYEDNNDNVRLEVLTFPGSNQNIMPYLSQDELTKAQAELENAYEQAAIDKAAAIRERREMAGDFRRELARDQSMLASHARAAHQAIFGGAK